MTFNFKQGFSMSVTTTAREPFNVATKTPNPARHGIALHLPAAATGNVQVWPYCDADAAYSVPIHEMVPGETYDLPTSQLFQLKSLSGTQTVYGAEYEKGFIN